MVRLRAAAERSAPASGERLQRAWLQETPPIGSPSSGPKKSSSWLPPGGPCRHYTPRWRQPSRYTCDGLTGKRVSFVSTRINSFGPGCASQAEWVKLHNASRTAFAAATGFLAEATLKIAQRLPGLSPLAELLFEPVDLLTQPGNAVGDGKLINEENGPNSHPRCE